MKSFTYPLVQNGSSYSLALFYILYEIMGPSVTTYVSEGPRIMLRYIRNGFLDIY